MKYGYVRVSTAQQHIDRQIDALLELGLDQSSIFIDYESGKDFNRKNYKKLIRKLKKDDLVIIKSIDRLGRDYNMIIEELALEYLPLRIKEKVQVTNQKIYFSELAFKPLRVLGVINKNGDKVPYKLINDYLELSNDDVIIEYTHRTKEAFEDDDCVYDETVIGPYVIAYGMLSQYLLERGRVSESNIYQEKYLSAVRARIAQRKSLKLPARRWF